MLFTYARYHFNIMEIKYVSIQTQCTCTSPVGLYILLCMQNADFDIPAAVWRIFIVFLTQGGGG